MKGMKGGKRMGSGSKPGLSLRGDTHAGANKGAKRSEGKETGHGMMKRGGGGKRY
jgi:hypothetical protein